ncbi:MAG: N-acetyltransferase [Ruminococcus flavefaciens]|nr:N-acetyltransferase [Ruminococcus flavefaciens]
MIIGHNTIISENAIISDDSIIGNNVCIQDNVEIGRRCKICDGSILCAGSKIGPNSYLDYGVILRENVFLGENAFVGARSILGEYLVDFMEKRDIQRHKTFIGKEALIRSETIIYGETTIGDYFQTGHRTTIREKSIIGHHVRLGTMTDIQGNCRIGNYVSMQSGVYVAAQSVIKDFVWLFPHVVLTNDPHPPSEVELGITVEDFACVAARSVILPGKVIGRDSLVGAGSVVNKDVTPGKVVAGNPCREIGDAVKIKNKATGEDVYPWRYHFDRGMPWKNIGYDEWATHKTTE